MSNVLPNLSGLLKTSASAGQAIADGLEAVRTEIVDLHHEREEIQRLPVDEAVAVQRARQWAAQVSLSAQRFSLSPDRFRNAPDDWVMPPDDPALAMAAYMGDALAAAVEKRVRDEYEENPGVSEKERTARLAQIDTMILKAELTEEAIIRTSEASGFKVYRRADADPRAVLAHDSALPRN